MRVLVNPRPDDPFDRCRNVANQMVDRVAIAIMPATDRQNGGFDLAVIFANRTVFPELVACLMIQPRFQMVRLVFQPVFPRLTPTVWSQFRIRRPRGIGQHLCGPAKVLTQKTTALIVDVIGIAIYGRHHRDHRLQSFGLLGGDLKAVEATPADPLHADIASTPRLRPRPGDHLASVVPFLLGVFILHQPVAVAVAAHVDADIGIAMPRHPRMAKLVPRNRPVALAIGQVLKDHRNGIVLGIFGHPDARRQAAAVGHDDMLVFDDLYLAGEVGSDLHDHRLGATSC